MPAQTDILTICLHQVSSRIKTMRWKKDQVKGLEKGVSCLLNVLFSNTLKRLLRTVMDLFIIVTKENSGVTKYSMEAHR